MTKKKKRNIFEMIDGYKTFIAGWAGVVVVALALFGFIDGNTANTLLVLLGFGGMIALRHGVKKLE
jgi:hypothetical protein